MLTGVMGHGGPIAQSAGWFANTGQLLQTLIALAALLATLYGLFGKSIRLPTPLWARPVRDGDVPHCHFGKQGATVPLQVGGDVAFQNVQTRGLRRRYATRGRDILGNSQQLHLHDN